MPTPKKTSTPMASQSAPCVHVKTQAELDAALAGNCCIHVNGDAEPSVLQWQAENPPEIEIAGEWGPST